MSEFDSYAEDYEDILAPVTKMSGFDHAYFYEYKIKEVYSFVGSRTAAEKEISFLNFGCGIGKSEKFIRKYFPKAHIYSIDTSKRSIEIAKERNREMENVFFEFFDGYEVPFQNKFDVIFLANVLHHISRDEHLRVLKNLRRALSEEGHLFVFEHNPLNPLTSKIVRSCELDKNAILLSPVYTYTLLGRGGFEWRRIRFKVFFPKVLAFLIPLEKYLTKIPLGGQYCLISKKRRAKRN
jgi:SAM-dependent methyltransferase